ncbi:unnamed protein product, partial [Rotaria sp. Silwood2]
ILVNPDGSYSISVDPNGSQDPPGSAFSPLYQYVINLLSPLKINQYLRNQQTISIEELSSKITHHLGQSWARETDENTNEDSDVESDNETNNNRINDLTSNYDSDEDLEFDDGFHSINNATTSANRGVRLVDNVNEKLSQTYF